MFILVDTSGGRRPSGRGEMTSELGLVGKLRGDRLN